MFSPPKFSQRYQISFEYKKCYFSTFSLSGSIYYNSFLVWSNDPCKKTSCLAWILDVVCHQLGAYLNILHQYLSNHGEDVHRSKHIHARIKKGTLHFSKKCFMISSCITRITQKIIALWFADSARYQHGIGTWKRGFARCCRLHCAFLHSCKIKS